MYLKIKADNQTKIYSIKTSAEKPYLKVSGGCLPLTTRTTTGIRLKAKVGNSVYNAMAEAETKTRTYYTTASESSGMSDVTALTESSETIITDGTGIMPLSLAWTWYASSNTYQSFILKNGANTWLSSMSYISEKAMSGEITSDVRDVSVVDLIKTGALPSNSPITVSDFFESFSQNSPLYAIYLQHPDSATAYRGRYTVSATNGQSGIYSVSVSSTASSTSTNNYNLAVQNMSFDSHSSFYIDSDNYTHNSVKGSLRGHVVRNLYSYVTSASRTSKVDGYTRTLDNRAFCTSVAYSNSIQGFASTEEITHEETCEVTTAYSGVSSSTYEE